MNGKLLFFLLLIATSLKNELIYRSACSISFFENIQDYFDIYHFFPKILSKQYSSKLISTVFSIIWYCLVCWWRKSKIHFWLCKYFSSKPTMYIYILMNTTNMNRVDSHDSKFIFIHIYIYICLSMLLYGHRQLYPDLH